MNPPSDGEGGHDVASDVADQAPVWLATLLGSGDVEEEDLIDTAHGVDAGGVADGADRPMPAELPPLNRQAALLIEDNWDDAGFQQKEASQTSRLISGSCLYPQRMLNRFLFA